MKMAADSARPFSSLQPWVRVLVFAGVLTPALLAVDGLFARRDRRRGDLLLALAGLVLNLVAASFPMRRTDVAFMNHLSQSKRHWVDAYLETGSIEEAKRSARFEVYPWSPESIRQKEKLETLKDRKLDLYRGRDS